MKTLLNILVFYPMLVWGWVKHAAWLAIGWVSGSGRRGK